MIGIKTRTKGIVGVEIVLHANVYKYPFPQLELLKYKNIVAIQCCTPLKGISGNQSILPIEQQYLTLKNTKGLVIVDRMPLIRLTKAYERGFQINDNIDFVNSFIEFELNPRENQSMTFNVIYTDKEDSKSLQYGYISESIIIPNSGYWQSLALFNKLDDSYKVCAIETPVPAVNNVKYLTLKNSDGINLFDKVYDQSFRSQSVEQYPLDDIDRLEPVRINFKTSEIFCLSTAGILTNIPYTIGLIYRRR